MSLITFRNKDSSGDPVGPTWYLQFDALTVEDLSRSAEVTQYPVESGAVLSDHYQPLPREITMTGVITDTPTGDWTNLEGMRNAAAPLSMLTRKLKLEVPRDPALRVGAAGIARPISTSFLPSRRLVRSNVERARLYIPKWAMTLQPTRSDLASELNTPTGSTQPLTRVADFVGVIDGLMQSRTSVSVILQTGAEYTNMFITDMRAPRVAGSSGSISLSVDMVEVIVAEPVKETGTARQREEPAHKPSKPKGTQGTKPVVETDATSISRFENIEGAQQ
jgi:hypothetical protein